VSVYPLSGVTTTCSWMYPIKIAAGIFNWSDTNHVVPLPRKDTTLLAYVLIATAGIYNPTREICSRRKTVYV
jgi:hypothetical protein